MQGKMVGSEVAIKSSINKSPLDSYYEFFIYLFIYLFCVTDEFFIYKIKIAWTCAHVFALHYEFAS
jgi:hypothetical protein